VRGAAASTPLSGPLRSTPSELRDGRWNFVAEQSSIQPQLVSPKLQAPFGYFPGGIDRIRPRKEVRGKPA